MKLCPGQRRKKYLMTRCVHYRDCKGPTGRFFSRSFRFWYIQMVSSHLEEAKLRARITRNGGVVVGKN